MFLTFLRQHFGTVVILIGAWAVVAAPIAIGSDGLVRFDSLAALLRDGKLDHSKYSLYGPLAAAPLWYLGEAIGYPKETVWTFNRIVFLAATVGLWLVLRSVLPRVERVRFLVFLFFGSLFPWHMMGFFGEVFHAACVGLGLAILAVCRSVWAVLGGVLCVWGTANMPASALGLTFAACVLCWHRRRLRYLLLPAIAAALIAIENDLRHGNPLEGGYAGEAGHRTILPFSGLPGFSYPLFFGLLSVLFSFGKGLVFFTPGLFARYPQDSDEHGATVRLIYRLWMAVVVGLVLVYARWWAWYGGAVWGPRFFLFASLPASLVLARWTARAGGYPSHAGGNGGHPLHHAAEHSTWANLFVLAAVVLSCWVGANGIVFQGHGSELFWRNDFELEYLTWYVPEYSVLWMPFVFPKPLGWQEYARLAAFALGFAYLAWPVACVLVIRLRSGCVRTWYATRNG